MRSTPRHAWAAVALAAAVLLSLCAVVNSRPLLAASADPVQCGDPPEHCKPKDAVCTLRTMSGCIPPYKCRGGKCSEPPADKAQGSSTAPASTTGEDGEVSEDSAPKSAPPDDSKAPTGCGNPPEHCKPKGAECKPRKVSECAKDLKCDKGTHKCVEKAAGKQPTADSPGDSEAAFEEDEEVPADQEDDTETEHVQDNSSSSSTAPAAKASSSASSSGGGTATSSSQATSGR